MSSYCVIGSGISGATIANLLVKKILYTFMIKLEVQVADHPLKD